DAVFGDAAGPANVTFDITTDLKAGDVVYLIVDGRDRNGADWHRVDYLTIGSIPEPATMGLFAAGGLAALLRRKRG
ncbi:MAG: PEP-CTERM sorting domain-containing protein, partial [Phycisphaerae bacterium]